MTPDHGHGTHERRWWRTRFGWVLVAFLAIGAFFFLAEHRAHVLGALPFVLLLACPLLHVFLHGGHKGRDGPGALPESRKREP